VRDLQIVGIIFALLIAIYGFWKRKQRRYTRQQLAISWLIAGGLLVISLFPSAGDLIAGPLSMERWNAVLFVSTLISFGLFFYVLNMSNANARTISRLVNALARTRFWQEHQDCPAGEIAVVIPAYNEAKNIGIVLQQIPQEVLGKRVQTFVVVDGGKDNTEQVVRQMGVPVIVHPINRGGGAALRAGYEIALESKAEIIVTLDADGQHLPEEISLLVKPILDGEADFVSGSRVLGSFEKESEVRALGVVFFNWLITILMSTRVTDASNAFRAIRADTLRKLTLYQDQFHTSELLIEALKKGARVKEVPITIRKRQSGVTKKPRSLKYGWGFAKAIFGTWLR
jgi:hypothetical protein